MDPKERNKVSSVTHRPHGRGTYKDARKEKTPVKDSPRTRRDEERNNSGVSDRRDISEISDSEESSEEEDLSQKEITKCRIEPSTKHNCFALQWLKKLAVIIILISCAYALAKTSTSIVDVKDCPAVMRAVNEEISHNNNEIMTSLISGLNEIKRFDKPSVFLYLYKNIPEDYVKELLKNITTYASCSLNEQNEPPIELTSIDLRSPEAMNDYGYIIEKYKDELERKHIMVVRHLEQVPGFVAQAFHTLCDEISPLVSRSLFIFTMQVENYKYSDFKLVENVLRAKWTELEEDVFSPLLTRISSMIVRINK